MKGLVLLGAVSLAGAASAFELAAVPAPETDASIESPAFADSARAAYQAAWANRQAGNFDLAVEVADFWLERIRQELDRGPDMSTRHYLNDLHGRLGGLRDAARKDLRDAEQERARGENPDAPEMMAPGIGQIELQTNPQVERYIEFFTGAGRSTFERWLQALGPLHGAVPRGAAEGGPAARPGAPGVRRERLQRERALGLGGGRPVAVPALAPAACSA